MAARLATGDILVNLDADTFTGPNLEARIIDVFKAQPRRVVQVGRGGTIALARSEFDRLGGYDERFFSWGFEDVDLIARAVRAGLEKYKVMDRRHRRRIEHDNHERVKHTGRTFSEAARKNRRQFRENNRLNVVKVGA